MSLSVLLTRLPRIWLMAALSFRVHSATTLALISFMYSMKAFRGFLIWGFLSSSFLGTGDFLLIRNIEKKPLTNREWCGGTGKLSQTRVNIVQQRCSKMTILIVLTHALRGWCYHRWVPALWLGRQWRDGECRSGGGCAAVESPCEGRNGWTPSWGRKHIYFNTLTDFTAKLKKDWANLPHNCPVLFSMWNSLCLLCLVSTTFIHAMSNMLAFCSNKEFFKSPFIQQWLEKCGVCCYHGDSMAMTPETTFLTTFQTMESVLTAVHNRTPLQSVSLNFQLLIQWSIVMDKGRN